METLMDYKLDTIRELAFCCIKQNLDMIANADVIEEILIEDRIISIKRSNN